MITKRPFNLRRSRLKPHWLETGLDALDDVTCWTSNRSTGRLNYHSVEVCTPINSNDDVGVYETHD